MGLLFVADLISDLIDVTQHVKISQANDLRYLLMLCVVYRITSP